MENKQYYHFKKEQTEATCRPRQSTYISVRKMHNGTMLCGSLLLSSTPVGMLVCMKGLITCLIICERINENSFWHRRLGLEIVGY